MSSNEKIEECKCSCHRGVKKYHVIWKPCCEHPVQGGIQMGVFPVSGGTETVYIIGLDEEDAKENLRRA